MTDHPGYPGQCCDTSPCTCQDAPLLDLDAIQARADAATPGPWGHFDGNNYADVAADYQQTGRGSYSSRQQVARIEADWCFDDPQREDWDEDDAAAQAVVDAEFIAAARTDVPALVAEIRRLRTESAELAAELDGRDEEARERWIQKQLDETGIRSMEFRNGAHMDLEPARELVAHWVAAARTMLGDAPNYSETKLEFDVKVAESPELYTLVVQRHAPGALTPHEARQRAEDRLAAVLALLPKDPAEDINTSCVPLRHIRAAATGQTRPTA